MQRSYALRRLPSCTTAVAGCVPAVWSGLTLELTPRAEAGGVSLVRDDALSAADQAYGACRSASGVERPVRPHLRRLMLGLGCARTN